MKERSKSGAMLDMVDAASLLTRFDLEGQDPGRERWEALLGLVQPHTEDHVLAFNDAHIAMVLSRLDDEELVQKHSASIAKYSRLWDFDLRSIKCRKFFSESTGDNARIMRDLGEQICESVVAFNSEKYELAFDCLYPIRTQVFQIGGSAAQVPNSEDTMKSINEFSGMCSHNC